MKYQIYITFFKTIELFLFLLPAFPPDLYARISMMVVYFIGHLYGVQRIYLNYKNDILEQFHETKEDSATVNIIYTSI
jgi:hypothetical protein